MNRKYLVLCIVAAVIGLMIVQFFLLLNGIQLERQRFEERIKIVLNQVGEAIQSDTKLDATIEQIMTTGKYVGILENSHSLPAIMRLDSLIGDLLDQKQIFTDYEWALTRNFGETVYHLSPGLEGDNFQFGFYNFYFEKANWDQTRGRRMLQLRVTNVFRYLLYQMSYLLAATIFCLGLLSFCFWYLNRMLRREEILNETKNDFINNLTHELKSPSFAIELAQDLGQKATKNEDCKGVVRYFDIIKKENNKLQTHIEKVLELASLERSTPAFQLKKIELVEWLTTFVREFEDGKLGKGTIVIKDDGLFLNQEQIFVEIDVVHFKNVLNNLIGNGLKYNRRSPKISIQIKEKEAQIFLKITDNGIGIPNEQWETVFQKFYRLPRPDDDPISGYGLGLYYIKTVIEGHGGRIFIERSDASGTTFQIQLAKHI